MLSDVNDPSRHLIWAAGGGDLSGVQRALAQGADVTRILIEDGANAFHIAAEFGGSVDVVRYLVEEGQADVNAVNWEGMTPLLFAAESKKLDIVRYLVEEQNADVSAKSNDGSTILHYSRLPVL